MDDIPKDDFKWFGEGFDGFPKRLPEDVVEYIIYIIDTKLSDVQIRERLQGFQKALASLKKKFLKEYIWQRESIKLDLIRENGRWLLKGSTNYGDSVADEWLIVWLLRELSKEFRDAWIRIYDTDGEFLLIEAANALPKWLNPEVADNRVWINNHRLLIIPLSKVQNPGPLTVKESLSIITDTPAKPQHYPKVEEEAFHRLKSYPAGISENQHHATLPLPRKVAHILHINPSYISPVVEAFYLRDPIALRLLQPDKAKAPLVFPPEDFVDVSVRFTRVLYAQLLGQTWGPSGPWHEALEKLVKERGQGQMYRDKASLGIKVAAGMEMLVRHSIYADKKPVREIKVLLEDLDTGDDSLPDDKEIAQWPKVNDDEGWLDINYADFERELAGQGGGAEAGGFGDKNAQDNLRKMVERFKIFIDDEDAGVEGAHSLDPMDMDNDSDEPRGWEDPEDSDEANEKKDGDSDQDKDEDSEDEEEYADKEFKEYEDALEKFMALSSAEKSALLDDARELARAEEAEEEEDEEIRKLSEAMEKELFGHGALHSNERSLDSDKSAKKAIDGDKAKGKGKAKLEELSEEENDDEPEYLDDDYNLADNMLKAFKGQAGMAGPAGNLMGLMGIQFPPDADDEEKEGKAGRA